MTTITARAIKRSRHAQRPDLVLSSILCRYPRPIHAELMTHRVLSRNSASSRAIPVEKLIQSAIDEPYIPLVWGKNQKGMQASEYFEGPEKEWLVREWLKDRDDAVERARKYAQFGCHKQIVNRILEPFTHITVLISSTQWNNFLALRDHHAAEPHIQLLAKEVRRELERADNIQTLQPGQWHLPFIEKADIDTATLLLENPEHGGSYEDLLIPLSVARCASTSYKTVDGFDMDLKRAVELHDRLVVAEPLHASPAEHVAQADNCFGSRESTDVWGHPSEHGNFVGFRQYRKMLANEWVPG